MISPTGVLKVFACFAWFPIEPRQAGGAVLRFAFCAFSRGREILSIGVYPWFNQQLVQRLNHGLRWLGGVGGESAQRRERPGPAVRQWRPKRLGQRRRLLQTILDSPGTARGPPRLGPCCASLLSQ